MGSPTSVASNHRRTQGVLPPAGLCFSIKRLPGPPDHPPAARRRRTDAPRSPDPARADAQARQQPLVALAGSVAARSAALALVARGCRAWRQHRRLLRFPRSGGADTAGGRHGDRPARLRAGRRDQHLRHQPGHLRTGLLRRLPPRGVEDHRRPRRQRRSSPPPGRARSSRGCGRVSATSAGRSWSG